MKVLFVTDGADESSSFARILPMVLPQGVVHALHIAAITWPVHSSPLWAATWDRLLTSSDLHHAVYETATEHVARLKQAASAPNVRVFTRIECGLLLETIPAITDREGFEGVILARGLPESEKLVKQLSVPTLYIGSPARDGSQLKVRRNAE